MASKRRATQPRPPPTAAGDSHNFGRRVTIAKTRVHKPRTVFWEWLMLGAGSPLRALLGEIGGDTFAFLPELRFASPTSPAGGTVERLALEPLGRPSRAGRRALAVALGRSIATWSWFGVSDLHWENLALGRGRGGCLVLTPLDVEIVLEDLALPTATKLVPEADPEYAEINRHACGSRRVLPYLGKPIDVGDLVAMAEAYRRTLGLLDREARAIAALLAETPGLREAPIRVLLRGTGDYVRARSEPVWPPLLDAEAEQLARGDIPYFFRLYGQPGIHFFDDPTLARASRLPLRGDVPRLEPLLSLARGLRSPKRASLREQGLFAVLGAFDHPSFTGTHADGDLAVTFGGRAITIRIAGAREELSVGRDLSAHVGSVYLPCRCGEVRTALVPAVTRCTPG